MVWGVNIAYSRRVEIFMRGPPPSKWAGYPIKKYWFTQPRHAEHSAKSQVGPPSACRVRVPRVCAMRVCVRVWACAMRARAHLCARPYLGVSWECVRMGAHGRYVVPCVLDL